MRRSQQSAVTVGVHSPDSFNKHQCVCVSGRETNVQGGEEKPHG